MRQKKVFAVLIAAVILLSAFAVFGNFSGQEAKAPLFQVDHLLIKVLVKSGENYSGSLKVTNLGGAAGFSANVIGVESLLDISEKNFNLNAGQPKLLLLDIIPNGNQPGIYVGKIEIGSGGEKKGVPVIIEVQTKDVLFAPNLNVLPQNRIVSPGSDNTIDVRLFNLKDREMNSVLLDYSLSDLDGNTIITETESAIISTQASFFKTLHIPEDTKPGQYVFAVRARYNDSAGTSSYLFDVASPKEAVPGLPAYYRDAAAAGAAVFAIIVLVLLFMQSGTSEVAKEFEKEMKAHRREALSKRSEIEEMRRRLEEEYRRKLAEELQKHGRKKTSIAKNIKGMNSELEEHAKNIGEKTGKSIVRSLLGFRREWEKAEKKISEDGKQREAQREREKKMAEGEKKRMDAEREQIKAGKEREERKLAQRIEERKRREELQKAEAQKRKEREKKILEAQREERKKREAELGRKKIEAMKRKFRHESFKFLHNVGLARTKKEKLEEERRKRIKAERELRLEQRKEQERKRIEAGKERQRLQKIAEGRRLAGQKKREEELERKRILAKIRELEALEKQKETEWIERRKRLEMMEKRHRKYEQSKEIRIESDTEQQKEISKSLESRKKEKGIEEHKRMMDELESNLQKLRLQERQTRQEESAAMESLGKEYKNHLKGLEEKRILSDSEMKRKEKWLKTKYGNLEKQFAKAAQARKSEEKKQAERLKEEERKERQKLELAEKEKMERLRAERLTAEEEKRKRLEQISGEEKRKRQRLEQERRAEAERQSRLRKLQRERYIRKIKAKMAKGIRILERDSFNVLHSLGLARTEEEKRKISLIKEREKKESEILENRKMAEEERRKSLIRQKKEEEKKLLEQDKKRKAEIGMEEKRKAERLKKLIGQRRELVKKKEKEERRMAEERIKMERVAAAVRQAALIKEKESLVKNREAEFAELKKSLQNRRNELGKSMEANRQKIKESEGRLARKGKKIKEEETEKERALIYEYGKNLAKQKALERKHIEEEKKAELRLSEQRKEIMGLKLDSLMFRLGLKGLPKKKEIRREEKEG